MKVTRSVIKAKAYGDIGSTGLADNKLLRQCRFPLEYARNETLAHADHDRLFAQDYNHARRALQEHTHSGELNLPQWIDGATDLQVFGLLEDILKVEEHYPGVRWTGYRVTATVVRGSGKLILSLWLFAKRDGSETKVYTDWPAPNVIEDGENMNSHMDGWKGFAI